MLETAYLISRDRIASNTEAWTLAITKKRQDALKHYEEGPSG